MQCPSILSPSQAHPLILLPQGLLEPHCSEQGMELLRCVLGIFRKIRTGSGMGGMGELWLSYPRAEGAVGPTATPKESPAVTLSVPCPTTQCSHCPSHPPLFVSGLCMSLLC